MARSNAPRRYRICPLLAQLTSRGVQSRPMQKDAHGSSLCTDLGPSVAIGYSPCRSKGCVALLCRWCGFALGRKNESIPFVPRQVDFPANRRAPGRLLRSQNDPSPHHALRHPRESPCKRETLTQNLIFHRGTDMSEIGIRSEQVTSRLRHQLDEAGILCTDDHIRATWPPCAQLHT